MSQWVRRFRLRGGERERALAAAVASVREPLPVWIDSKDAMDKVRPAAARPSQKFLNHLTTKIIA